jgi:uncharacterized protein YhbP (UPF0306 family)
MEYAKAVGEMLQTQRTMVLATADPQPWSAPVYFIYIKQRFYFFSSPDSRHIVAARQSRRCAATIFRDSANWRDIEGLQMDGSVETIPFGTEAVRAFRGYVKKFPTVKNFFADAAFDIDQFLARFRTRLYAFVPQHVYYLNNQAGLAKRQEIELDLPR